MDSPEAAASVIVADKHAMVAQGLGLLLRPRVDVRAVVYSGKQLIQAAAAERPDVIVAEFDLGDMSGLDAISELRVAEVHCPVVIVTTLAEPELAQSALRRGAHAYVVKASSSDQLVTAIGHALEQRRWISPQLGSANRAVMNTLEQLTERQKAVLTLVGHGLRAKQVAHHLGLSVRTVEAHKFALMQAFDVHTTLDLLREAQRLGLVTRLDGARD